VSAIRDACARLGTFSLEGAELYTSCEPCPMCLAAAYWARIGRVFYANTTADAAAIGFDDAVLYEQVALAAEQRSLPCERLTLDEAEAVFASGTRCPISCRTDRGWINPPLPSPRRSRSGRR